jgi:nucleotidyltransferase substrate binding protein (TIGR01987 family)
MSGLDVAPFARALARLEEGLARHLAAPEDEQLRDGLVLRFTFSYEQAHRMLRRVLAATSPDPEAVDAMTFQELIRTGNEAGLVRGSWPAWRTFREMRARTRHTYHAETADAVVARLPVFIDEAQALRQALAERTREEST